MPTIFLTLLSVTFRGRPLRLVSYDRLVAGSFFFVFVRVSLRDKLRNVAVTSRTCVGTFVRRSSSGFRRSDGFFFRTFLERYAS